MEGFSFDVIQILIGFALGLILGFMIFKLTSPKTRKSIASSADDSGKLQNEVLRDEVKHLQDKVVTLEKALDMKLK
jgi:uncharacterized membrane-anchored protein YhcB (DUF1043 family)